nr:p22 [Norovirus GI]
GKMYDFDDDRVSAFTTMARDNGLGILSMAGLGKKLRGVTSMEGLKNALKGHKIGMCTIKWQAKVYSLESDGNNVNIREEKNVLTQQQQSVCAASIALTRLRAARAVAYASCIQSAITSILQIAASALVVNRAVKRMFGTRTAALSLEGPPKEHKCRVHQAKAAGKGPIGHDDMVEKYGLCETEEDEEVVHTEMPSATIE